MIFGITILEVIVLTVLAILFIISAAYDRSHRSYSFKWWTLVLGIAALILMFGPNEWSVSAVWNSILSWEFWRPIVIYFSLGALYSIVEFLFQIRRESKILKESWSAYISTKVDVDLTMEEMSEIDGVDRPGRDKKIRGRVAFPVKQLLEHAQSHQSETTKDRAERLISSFRNLQSWGNSDFIVKPTLTTSGVEPEIQKGQLFSRLTVWILFWPAYMLSLLLGDIIEYVVSNLKALLVTLSNRFIKYVFADTFKI
jgi:hypothetical protein